jgi:hypothetical protein
MPVSVLIFLPAGDCLTTLSRLISQPVKLLLAPTSLVNFNFKSHQYPWPYFCSFQNFYMLRGHLLTNCPFPKYIHKHQCHTHLTNFTILSQLVSLWHIFGTDCTGNTMFCVSVLCHRHKFTFQLPSNGQIYKTPYSGFPGKVQLFELEMLTPTN